MIAGLPAGDLSTTSYAVLLSAMARTGRSGLLQLVRPPVEKQVVVVDGRPVGCRSNLAHETFGRFLKIEGKLSGDDHTSTLSESLSRGVPLGEVLVERGLLTPHEVYRYLQKNLARKLLDGFTWDRGEFRLTDQPPEVDRTIRLNALQLILTGVVKLTPQAEIDAGIDALRSEPLALDPHQEVPHTQLRLSGHGQRLVAALERGPRLLDELIAEVELPESEVSRTVYALALVGRVLAAEEIAGKGAPAEGTPGPGAASAEPGQAEVASAVAAQPSDTEALLLRQASIVEAYLSFQRKDAFDFLGLEEGATPPEIDSAYLEAAEIFAPWTLVSEEGRDFAEQAEVLFLKAAEAYAELKNSESRGALIYRRKVLREEEAGRKRPRFAIKTDLLDSEEQFKKGLELLDRGELGKALEYLEFAAHCDTQNAAYRAELAYRRQEFDGHRYRQQSLDDLREALRIDPRCGVASYYLGLMLGEGGDVGTAEELLRRSIKLMAPDRRPIEALKALSGRKKR